MTDKKDQIESAADHVQACWIKNAGQWTRLVREGYDVHRNFVNTPTFISMLPEINGKTGLDVGCGEGYNTRLFAERGPKITAIDPVDEFLRSAEDMEASNPLGISYVKAIAHDLPFENESFDFAVSNMVLMDLPDLPGILREVFRVLKAGGFFQFSTIHPCVDQMRQRDRDGSGHPSSYFDEIMVNERWMFANVPDDIKQNLPEFEIPYFHRTLTTWINSLVEAGFVIERIAEPQAKSEDADWIPVLDTATRIPIFLIIRVRKP